MSLQLMIESALYSASQLFMLPVLLAVLLMFFYAFYALGPSSGRAVSGGAARRWPSTCCRAGVPHRR